MKSNDQTLYLLAHNEQLGGLRETEALLVRFLRESGVHLEGRKPSVPYRPFALPDDAELSHWGDPARRRLGFLVNLIAHLPPANAGTDRQRLMEYANKIKSQLDPSRADQTTWYAGDRPAQLWPDHPIHQWGLLSGVHINRIFQGLETGVL